MITTDESLFRNLKNKGFNMVLLNKSRARDDGSLGIFCAREGIVFISIETIVGHEAEQKSMLTAIDGILQ